MSRDQFSITPNAILIQDESPFNRAAQNDSPRVAKEEPQNGTNQQAEMAACYSQKLQDDLKAMGLKIKQHEQNIKFLKSEKSNLDESILDMQVSKKEIDCKKESVVEEMKREQEQLDQTRFDFEVKKQEFVNNFLAQTTTTMTYKVKL